MSDNVPEAVVEQILLRLPPKTLVLLSSVCKSWLSLITSHSFISSHFQRSLSNPTPPILFIHQYTDMPSFVWHHALWPQGTSFPSNRFARLEPPYRTGYRYSFDIVESLHGILCITEARSKDYMHVRAIILWNPSVGRHIRLETPTPAKYSGSLGFGFDSRNNDFKVIRFFNSDRVELYSLNEGAWRDIDCPYPEESMKRSFSGTRCFLNGNVHWIVALCYSYPVTVKENYLLIFNVEVEEFEKMQLPPDLVSESLPELKVAVIEGCLSVLHYYCSTSSGRHGYGCAKVADRCECDIWMMTEYGVSESWIKMSTINIQRGVSLVIGISTTSKVLVLQHNPAQRYKRGLGDEELVSLHYFDHKSEEIMDLGVQGYGISNWEYTESLLLLDRERYVNKDAS